MILSIGYIRITGKMKTRGDMAMMEGKADMMVMQEGTPIREVFDILFLCFLCYYSVYNSIVLWSMG